MISSWWSIIVFLTTIKKREKQLIDGIAKHSQKLQNEIEMERKTVKKTFCDMKRQADQAEKTIILHQDEIMAALKSIQGSTIFTAASSCNFSERIFSTGSKLCFLCLDKIQSAHTR
jgi:hypothetical protein